MTTSKTITPKATELDQGPLRIVLFGISKAGKSSLLGALGKLQKENPFLLQDELVDHEENLEQKRELTFEKGSPRTEEEVGPVSVQLKPSGKSKKNTPNSAEIIDSDGHIAAKILVRKRAFREKRGSEDIGENIWNADAILLVMDAAANEEVLETVFEKMSRFLKELEQLRGEENEITDLPVFLVLTKCDLLAQKGDSYSDWNDRMEQKKADIQKRFQAYLAQDDSERPEEFGRLNLSPWTTALHRPALGSKPKEEGAAIGIKQLFSHCFHEARQYRYRRNRVARLLSWTMFSMITLALILAGLLTVLLSGILVKRESDLEVLIKSYRRTAGVTIEQRLHDKLPRLTRNREQLQSFLDHKLFPELDPEMQSYVRRRKEELDRYIPFLKAVLQNRSLTVARNDSELKERREKLQKPPLSLPEKSWVKSAAGRMRQRQLDDLNLLSERVDQIEDWYRQERESVRKLWLIPEEYRDRGRIRWRIWQPDAQEKLEEVKTPPATENIPVASWVSAYSIQGFERVTQLRQEFEKSREQLQALLDICFALQLSTQGKKPPVLVVAPRFQLDHADPKVALLKKHYTEPKQLTLNNVPDVAWGAVKDAATSEYQKLLVPAQNLIRQKHSELKSWSAVADWLKQNRKMLDSWEALSVVLQNLSSETPYDPVEELVSLLSKKVLSVTLESATLTVSLSSSDRFPLDGADLILEHEKKTYELEALKRQLVETKTGGSRQVYVYRYQAKNAIRLDYRPGEAIQMSVRAKNNKKWTWKGTRGEVYHLAGFTQKPWLHNEKEAPEKGARRGDLQLKLIPSRGIPPIPDLLPTTDK